ncbi:MAG: class I SAM-dependent DNA methyltransferase [Lactobacillus sp.]|nr:class I SAM-dependent DNA methyltransferase [Lactobacillus sp.]
MSRYALVVFSKKSRNLIIEAGELIGWDKVNPDILGSMLQAVASEDKRSHLGMHYTSVPNIMKVINPLFLDDLHEEFEKAKGNETKLNNLLERMRKMKFMDPACGSGNFLIITYKELRRLEMDIFEELGKINNSTMYVPTIDLGQFYGIEIEDFAVDVTRLSLYIADHQMNLELKRRYGDYLRETLPLHKVGDIRCGNALRLDWNEILPHEKDDEVYLFGNPPYKGGKSQPKEYKKYTEPIIGHIKGWKNLDYITCWFILGSRYISNSKAKLAFVTTNSITQGEQVSMLWPEVYKNNVDIDFAYVSFKWGNNAKKNAGVIVAIIGLSDKKDIKQRKLFNGNKIRLVDNISPYLTDGLNVIVTKSSKPINNLPLMSLGNMAKDGGNFMLSKEEKEQLLYEYPEAKKYIKKIMGSKELLNNIPRYCIWLDDENYKEAMNIPFIKRRIEQVREFRLDSTAQSTREAASYSYRFKQRGHYDNAVKLKNKFNVIIVPRVTSESRLYVPMDILDANTIVSDSMAIYDAPLWLLGLLESRMHMAWLRNVVGKLGTSYRYSSVLTYNTFPVPDLSTRRKREIESLIADILDIREEEGGTLAELYGSPLAAKNPKPMNPRLLEAHQELDKVVDRAYKSTDFKDDNERLALLLNMYSEMVNKKG